MNTWPRWCCGQGDGEFGGYDVDLDVHDADVDGHLVVSVLLLAILLAAGLLRAVLVVRLEQLKKLVRRTQIEIMWMGKIKITHLGEPVPHERRLQRLTGHPRLL